MQAITVDKLKQILDSDDNVQLIDVRSPAEYLAVRLQGSELMPINHFDQLSPTLDKQREVYALCRTGRRAKEFCQKIDDLGFRSVLVEGGIEAWIKQSYPVQRSPNIPWSIERQTRFGIGLLVLIGIILALTVHPYFMYFSGLVGLGLMMSGATDFCGMAIMLEKMPWNKKITGSITN